MYSSILKWHLHLCIVHIGKYTNTVELATAEKEVVILIPTPSIPLSFTQTHMYVNIVCYEYSSGKLLCMHVVYMYNIYNCGSQ